MKKTILTLTAVCGFCIANAQMATISTPEPLLKGVETNLFHPVLSTDGTRVLFSDADYSNLRTYDFESGVVSHVAVPQAEAFDARFDADGKVTVAAPTSVRTEGTNLIISKNGKETSYSPVDCYAGYLWSSMSPDGTKVMFVAAGKGVFIVDLDGNVIASPGKYEAPVWFGNDHILVQNTTDDGHQFTSSQILLLNLDGTQKQAVTRPESMTFSPSASATAGKAVFCSVDGRLYQVNITLNK